MCKMTQQKGGSALGKRWELLHQCCTENTQQIETLKHMVNELATAADKETSSRQADFHCLQETVHAEVIAHSGRLGIEDRIGKLEELLSATIDKYDVGLVERTAGQAFATEVPEMLESKWRLQGQLQERTLERNMAVLATEFEQRQAKLASDMQEFAAAMQTALELHKTSIKERCCIEKEAREVLNEAQIWDIRSIKASHDSQMREVQSIMYFLADEADSRQQQHLALEAARHQLHGHIMRIVEDCAAIREDKAPAPAEACAQESTSQHCMEVQQEIVQPAAYANAEERGRAAGQDDAARTAEVAHTWTPSAHTWVKQRPGGWAWGSTTTAGAKPYTPRCSRPQGHCRTATMVAKPASMPPDSFLDTPGVWQAEQQQQQQQQQQQSPLQLQQVDPQLPQLLLSAKCAKLATDASCSKLVT